MSTTGKNSRIKLDSIHSTNGLEVRQSAILVLRSKTKQVGGIEVQIYTKTRRKQEWKVARGGCNIVLAKMEKSDFIVAREYMNRNL